MNESIRTIFLDASAESVELREDLAMDASFEDFLHLYGGAATAGEPVEMSFDVAHQAPSEDETGQD